MKNKNKHNRVYTDQNGNSELVISSLLPVGKENAISTTDLVMYTGCSSARELQQYIARERKAGAVICSSTTGGYYRPANCEEMKEFCRTLENRARNTLIALQSTRKAINEQSGQQEENIGVNE